MNRRARFTLTAWILGTVSIIAGCAWIYPPLGLLFGGVALLGCGGLNPLRLVMLYGTNPDTEDTTDA
jgi:hypothetical protein